MKKLLLTAAAILATLNMYGQGSGIVNFANNGQANDRRVWVNDTGNVNEGTLAAGAAYQVALYWGAAGTTDDRQLTQIGAAANLLTSTAAGTFVGGNRTLSPVSANGGIVVLQVRGWAVADGSTYDLAAANPNGHVGKSAIFDMDTKDPTNPQELPPAIGAAPNFRGFGIAPVPEPSTIALGLLGAGALLMLRRRK
jgi:hypothetical protein